MKKIAKLNALAAEDQKLVLDLCARHTYPEVAAILAKPRAEGGLDLETNRSALSRFYQHNGWLGSNTDLARQFIETIQSHPQTGDMLPHIIQLMGQFTFISMAQGNPYEIYKKPLNTYLRLQSISLRKEKLARTASSSPQSRSFRPFGSESLTPFPGSAGAPDSNALTDFDESDPDAERTPDPCPAGENPAAKTQPLSANSIPAPAPVVPMPIIQTAPVTSPVRQPSPAATQLPAKSAIPVRPAFLAHEIASYLTKTPRNLTNLTNLKLPLPGVVLSPDLSGAMVSLNLSKSLQPLNPSLPPNAQLHLKSEAA